MGWLANYLNIRDLLGYDKLVMPLKALDVMRLSSPSSAILAAVIFNATSLGVHKGDPSPVSKAALRPGLLVYDIVYQREALNRLQTEALAAGALVCDGMMHIFEQAPFSFQMLTDREAPRPLMLESLVSATGRKPLDWGSDE